MKTPRIVRQVWAAILAALALATPVTASGADLTEFDLTRLYGKTIGDMADAQTPEGLVPDSAPEYVVFADGGRSDVIFAMNHQSEKPGYGYQLARGATSLTEAWNASPYSSQNHFMLGQIMEWFYGDLAGLAPDPTAPGFKNILVRP